MCGGYESADERGSFIGQHDSRFHAIDTRLKQLERVTDAIARVLAENGISIEKK